MEKLLTFKQIALLIGSILIVSFSYGQEVCNNGMDDDSDGLIDLNDTTDCVCTPSVGVPASLIPNPSFEAMDCCPSTYSQVDCATDWVQATSATSDYMNTCGIVFGAATDAGLLPFPDGQGILGAIFTPGWQEYVGACLTSPMVAGTSYSLQMNIASTPIDGFGNACGGGTVFYGPIDIVIFGSPNCSDLPSSGTGCPPAPWTVIGSATYNPVASWGVLTITFTPSFNVNTVIFGSPCTLPPDYSGASSCYPYFYFDNILLNESSMFSSSIVETGVWCNNDVVLTGSTVSGATYQWYQNGVAISGQTSPILNISAGGFPAGNYSLVTTDSGTCSVASDSVLSTVPAPVISPAGPFCSTDTAVNLVVNTPGGIWSGTGIVNTTAGTFDPAVAGPGTYQIVNEICGVSDTISIVVLAMGNSAWTSPGTMCASDPSVNLNTYVTGSPGGTWSGPGVTGSTFDPSGLSGSITLTYTTGVAPCDDVVSHSITVLTSANPTITPVGTLCSDASPITLTAVTAGGTWSGTGITNTSTGAFSPSAAAIGANIITYTIPGSCGGSDTIIVNVSQSGDASWTLQPSICEYEGSINLNGLVTGTPGGTWSGAGVSGSTFDPSGLSGNTTITYTAGTAPCADVLTLTINVSTINAGFNATPSSGLAPLTVVFDNTSSNATTYSWNYGNGISSSAIDSTMIYDNYGIYTVTLIAANASGCMDTAMITIIADAVSSMIVPNVFSPNGDPYNDQFIVNAEAIIAFHCEIYDRWGLKMYEWDDVTKGWNGKARNGSPAPDGTYYYMINATGFDGKEYVLKGFLSLVR